MKKIADFITAKYKIVLAVILLLTIPMGYFFTKQGFFNHVDIYFDANDPDLLFYKRFQKTYGNEEMAVIVFKTEDMFTAGNLGIIRDISKRVLATEGVQRVFSLTESEEAVGRSDTITFERVIPDGDLSRADLGKVKRRVMANKTIVGSVISPDGKTTAILIELQPMTDNEKKRAILLSIMDFSRRIAGSGIGLHFAGVPIVEVEMNTLSQRDFMTFTPITFILIFLVVWWLLRKMTLSVLCQFNLLICLVWGIGFFAMTGETFNIVTTIIGPLLLAISVADSIHILAHYREIYVLNGGDHAGAVHNTIRNVWLPCLFTSLTTMAGFASFVTSSIRPVKMMGIFTAIGVGFAFLLTITFIPTVLMYFKDRMGLGMPGIKKAGKDLPPSAVTDREDLFAAFLHRIGDVSSRYYRSIVIAMVVIFVVSIYGIYKIKFETNTMNYLPESNSIRRDITFIEENMGGTIPFVMLVQAKQDGKDFNNPESLRLINTIQEHMMKNIPQFSTSFSLADYFKEMNKAFNNSKAEFHTIPDSRTDILDFYELGESDVLDRIVAPDRREARISFMSRWDTNETAHRIHNYMVDYMGKTLGSDYSYKITGLSSMYLNMEFQLKASQRNSFIVALIIISLMMFVVCRRGWLALVSMIPNIFPIAVTMGIMGWFGIPLDVSTIMIASVTLGIAVDDTIHFVTWYTRNMAITHDRRAAILKTFRDVGKPIVITSVVLFLGFFILILGTIKPTQAFGVLTAFSMLFALIGDIIFLPALLMFFKPAVAKGDRDFLAEHGEAGNAAS